MSTSKTTASREHFLWQEMMAARTDLSAIEKTIAWRLALFRNVKSGRCDPSYTGIAAGAGASERTAKRAIAKFERLGLIAIERTPGGSKDKRNRYQLIMPGVSVQTPQGVSAETAPGVSGRARRGVRARPAGVSELSHTNTQTNMVGVPSEPPQHEERENELTLVDPDFGDGGRPDGAAPQDSRNGLSTEEAFTELLKLWVRGHLKDKLPEAVDIARRAYAIARDEATACEIFAGARVWVEAADAPRFLDPLPVWLACCGWREPPPKKRRPAKRTCTSAPPRSNGGKADLAKLMMQHGGRREDENGVMVHDGGRA